MSPRDIIRSFDPLPLYDMHYRHNAPSHIWSCCFPSYDKWRIPQAYPFPNTPAERCKSNILHSFCPHTLTAASVKSFPWKNHRSAAYLSIFRVPFRNKTSFSSRYLSCFTVQNPSLSYNAAAGSDAFFFFLLPLSNDHLINVCTIISLTLPVCYPFCVLLFIHSII